MITSDRRPARTRNTTIIVVLHPINAVAATPWVDFRVGRSTRTLPTRRKSAGYQRAGAGTRPARRLAWASTQKRAALSAYRAANARSALPQCRNPGFPAGPRNWRTLSAARGLTQGMTLENRRGSTVVTQQVRVIAPSAAALPSPPPIIRHRPIRASPQRVPTSPLP